MLRALCRRIVAPVAVLAAVVAFAPSAGASTVTSSSEPAAAISAPKIVSQVPALIAGIHAQQTFTVKVLTAIPSTGGMRFDFDPAIDPEVIEVRDANTNVIEEGCSYDAPIEGHGWLCSGASFIAGRTLRIIVTGTNGPIGVHSISAQTCTHCDSRTSEVNSAEVSSAAWVVVGAGAISQPSLTASPNKAEGAESTWTASFNVADRMAVYTQDPSVDSGALPDGWQNLSSFSVTIPRDIYQVTQFDTTAVNLVDTSRSGVRIDECGGWAFDQSTGQDDGTCALLGGGIAPHDHIVMSITEMANADTAGPFHVTVATTSDPTPVTSTALTLVPGKGVSRATVTLTPTDQVDVAVSVVSRFAVSSQGAMPHGGVIYVDIAGARASDVDDDSISHGTVTDGGRALDAHCGGDTPQLAFCAVTSPIAARDTLTVTLGDVEWNSTGSYNVTITTSEDPIPVNSAAFSVTGQRAVTQPLLTNLTEAPGTRSDYSIAFATSTHGGMASGGLIEVDYPQGTLIGYSVLVSTGAVQDVTQANITVGSCTFSNGATLQDSAPSEFCHLTHAVAANDHLVVTALGVTNPPTGTYTLEVSTSTDRANAESPEYDITGGVTTPQVTVSPTAVAGGLSHYHVQFATSPFGLMTSANGDFVLLQFPAGTGVGGDLTDSTITGNGAVIGACQQLVSPFVICTITAASVAAGDVIDVELNGIFNPAPGSYQIQVSTSIDQEWIPSSSYLIGASASVTGVSAALGPATAAGAVSNYAVTLHSSATGELSPTAHATVSVQFPAGTGLAALSSAQLTVGGSPVGTCPSTTGTLLVCRVTSDVPANTVMVVLANGVVNAPSGAHTVGVVTTGDPKTVVTAAFSTSAAAAVAGLTASVSGNVHAKAGTYTFTFEPSDGGTVGPGGSVTFAFPTGTDVSAVTTASITDGGEVEGGSCVPTATGSVTCSITGFLSADDLVQVVLKHVSNPPAGTYSATVTTSSDPLPATSSAYTIR